MPIVFQKTVTADSKYSFTNSPANTVFDFHNDSPYNMGVSFGRDTGIQGADIYTSPQSIQYGVPVPGATKYTTGGVKFSGVIYIYTQTPLGGTTNFSSSPAQSITVIAYPTGANPQGTTSLSRMQNLGNSVTTNMGGSNNLQNDNNAANTQFIEATQAGSSSSNVSFDNSGNSYIAQTVAGVVTKLFQTVANAATSVFLGAAGKIVEILGNVKVDGSLESVGAVTLDSTLAVTGASTLTGNSSVGGTFHATGATTLSNTLAVAGTSSLDNGAITSNGTGTLTVGGGLNVAGSEQVSTNLAVAGTSSLDNGAITTSGTGNVTIGGDVTGNGNVSLGTSGKAFKGKDQAGVTYPIAGFNAVTPKQVDMLDATVGQLLNIKSATKVNGNLTATGSSSLDNGTITTNGSGTVTVGGGLNVAGSEQVTTNLAVAGTSSLDNGTITTTGTGSMTVGGTETVSGVINANGGVTLPNNTFLKIKDHTGAVQSILEVDTSDLVRLFLTSLGDRMLVQDAAGTETYLDLQPNAIIIGDGTAKLPVTMHGNVNLTDGTLTVSGISTLTGDASAAGNVSLTTNNRFFKGKDQAGVTYPIAGFNSVTAKQLDILDGTSGQLTNIKSNTKVNGTFESTGAATFDSSALISSILSVVLSSSLDNGAITTDGSGTLQLNKAGTNFNGTVSGTATILTPLWGPSLKVMIVSFQNYNSANAISFALPSSMARGFIWIGNQGGGAVTSTFKNAGVAVSVRLITTLGGASAGATTTASNMFQDSMASIISTVDTWTLTATGGATSSAIVCVGV